MPCLGTSKGVGRRHRAVGKVTQLRSAHVSCAHHMLEQARQLAGKYIAHTGAASSSYQLVLTIVADIKLALHPIKWMHVSWTGGWVRADRLVGQLACRTCWARPAPLGVPAGVLEGVPCLKRRVVHLL